MERLIELDYKVKKKNLEWLMRTDKARGYMLHVTVKQGKTESRLVETVFIAYHADYTKLIAQALHAVEMEG